jgi:diketogulonate reductase-like aldo/keto reductase
VPLPAPPDPAHMRDDLAAFDFELDPAEVATIEALSG